MTLRVQRTATSRKRAQKHKQSQRGTVGRRDAARLAETALGGREWIWPPEQLYKESKLPVGPASALELTAPHWDGLREMLGDDGTGYLAVLELSKRLDRKVQEYEEARERTDDDASCAKMVLDILVAESTPLDAEGSTRTEAEGHVPGGFDKEATLADSLGSPVIAARAGDASRSWWWEIRPSQDRRIYDQYILHVCNPRSGVEVEISERLRTIPGGRTWKFAAMAHRMIASPTGPDGIEHEIMKWRSDIAALVLREFELLGYVRRADRAGTLQPPTLTTEGEAFIRAALDLRADELRAAHTTSRKSVLVEIAEVVGIELHEATAIAKKLGAYRERTGQGRGRLGHKDEEVEFKHFWDVITMLEEALNREG